MIRLISIFKRKPGTTFEEFRDHWLHSHAPLVASVEAAKGIVRYEQRFVTRPADGSEPPYDGVTMQWYESVESFWATTMDPSHVPVLEDTERFLDTSTLVWVLVDEEANVVIDRSEGSAGAGLGR